MHVCLNIRAFFKEYNRGTMDTPNWRTESGLLVIVVYKRRLAYLPTKCADGTKVWFTYYYKKYETWYGKYDKSAGGHTDFIENITEEEYTFRCLRGI